MTRWTARSGFCSICCTTVYTEKSSFNRHCAEHHEEDLVYFIRVPVDECQAVQDAMDAHQALPAPFGGFNVAAPASVPVVAPASVPVVASASAPVVAPASGADSSFPPPSHFPPYPLWSSGGTIWVGTSADDLRPQIRPSRSTRNQDHQAASRSRGIVDLDPTEGLPVQGWEQVPVKVNQDPSSEQATTTGAPSGVMSTTSPEWAAQFNTEKFPWSEKPLPSFFNQLPLHNQELIRRARCGNTNPTMSIYDRKTNSYITGIDAEKRARANQMKSLHLNNLGPSSTTNDNNNGAAASGPIANDDSNDQDDEDDNDDQHDDDIDDDDEHAEPTSRSIKRRKYIPPEDRTITVKRWVQVPQAVAEKSEERKFLADRRPGMPSLYGTSLQNEVFGQIGLTSQGYTTYGTSNAAYDLGDGAGLSSALGGGTGEPGPAAAPVRRNMPPKRKKKKGGPGRKKAAPATDANGVASQPGAFTAGEDVQMLDQDPDQAGDSGGDSEGEGSEEGELNEEKVQPAMDGIEQGTTSLTITTMATEPMALDEPAVAQEEEQVSAIAPPPAASPTAEAPTQESQPASEPAPKAVAETIIEHQPDVATIESTSYDEVSLIPEPIVVPESIPAPIAILDQSMDLSTESANVTDPVVQTITDPDTHELVSEPIELVEPAPTIPESMIATADAGSIVPESQPDTPVEVPFTSASELDPVSTAEPATEAIAEAPAQSADDLSTTVVEAPISEPSAVEPIPEPEKTVEQVTEPAQITPATTSEPEPASAVAPTSASTEIDLLGGLEDQLDRDMAS